MEFLGFLAECLLPFFAPFLPLDMHYSSMQFILLLDQVIVYIAANGWRILIDSAVEDIDPCFVPSAPSGPGKQAREDSGLGS